MPASLIGATYGIHANASTIVIAAQAAKMPKARRQERNSAIRVPAGTPSILATVCPVTITDTACASLPFSARVLAMSVAVPKNAPCGRPATNRATTSMAALTENAEARLPTKAITINNMMRSFGGTLRPNTRISVPKHTPIAYAEM